MPWKQRRRSCIRTVNSFELVTSLRSQKTFKLIFNVSSEILSSDREGLCQLIGNKMDALPIETMSTVKGKQFLQRSSERAASRAAVSSR